MEKKQHAWKKGFNIYCILATVCIWFRITGNEPEHTCLLSRVSRRIFFWYISCQCRVEILNLWYQGFCGYLLSQVMWYVWPRDYCHLIIAYKCQISHVQNNTRPHVTLHIIYHLIEGMHVLWLNTLMPDKPATQSQLQASGGNFESKIVNFELGAQVHMVSTFAKFLKLAVHL